MKRFTISQSSRVIAFILTLTLVFSVFPLSAFAGEIRQEPVASDSGAAGLSSFPAFAEDPQTSYEYTSTAMGFKEEIIVSSYTGQTEYSFLLDTCGLTSVNEYGSYVLVDEWGSVQASLSEIILLTADERNNAVGSMRAETVEEGERYLLTVELDAEWLSDPQTVYPITIDPSITLNTSENIEDVSIISTTTYSGTSGSLYIGRGSSGAALHTLMRFPNLNLSGYNVTSASVSIRDIMCEDNAAQTVECHEYLGNR